MTDTSSNNSHPAEDRRKFLESCGKFAVVTPPALMMLLSTSLTSEAIAHSGGRGPHGNNGHHGHWGWHGNNGHHWGWYGNRGHDRGNGREDGDR